MWQQRLQLAHLSHVCVVILLLLDQSKQTARLACDQVRGGRSGVRIPVGESFLFSKTQTDSRAHPASYSMCHGVVPRGQRGGGCEVDHSSPSSANVMNEWSYTCPLPVCFHGVNRDNFIFPTALVAGLILSPSLRQHRKSSFQYFRLCVLPITMFCRKIVHILCVCSLTYPTCKAHAPYFHLWPLWLHQIFRHYLINDTIFGKKLLIIKCVF